MDSQKKWYAIYTRPRWEKKVHQLLQNQAIESYCPLNKVCRQWSDRKKMVLEPLFFSYVFIHINESEFLPVKKTDGVINLVYWLGQPAVIRDEEIGAIRRFLETYENISLEKVKISVNHTVKIMEGPFMDMEGVVVDVRNNSVKVVLPSLGYALVAPVTRVAVLKDKSVLSQTA